MTKRFLAWAFDQAAWRFSAFQVLRPLESIADCGSQGSDGLECLVVEVWDAKKDLTFFEVRLGGQDIRRGSILDQWNKRALEPSPEVGVVKSITVELETWHLRDMCRR